LGFIFSVYFFYRFLFKNSYEFSSDFATLLLLAWIYLSR